MPGMRNEIYRGVAQDASPALLARLTESLVKHLTGAYYARVRDSTYMSSSLTGGLTHSLASTITHALKRSQKTTITARSASRTRYTAHCAGVQQ